MTYEGLGETFEDDSAETLAGKLPLVSMVGQAEGLACADQDVRTALAEIINISLLSCFHLQFHSNEPILSWSFSFKLLRTTFDKLLDYSAPPTDNCAPPIRLLLNVLNLTSCLMI